MADEEVPKKKLPLGRRLRNWGGFMIIFSPLWIILLFVAVVLLPVRWCPSCGGDGDRGYWYSCRNCGGDGLQTTWDVLMKGGGK